MKSAVIGYRNPHRTGEPNPFQIDGDCLPADKPFVHFMPELDAEDVKYMAELKASGLPQNEFLDRTLKPINDRISSSRGQVISAVTRVYRSIMFSSNPHEKELYSLEEVLHFGLIGEKTRVEMGTGAESLTDCLMPRFVQDVLNSGSSRREELGEEGFTLPERAYYTGNSLVKLFYFQREAPQTPPPNFVGGIVGVQESVIVMTDKPRLELYIGDGESVPVLQKRLGEEEYVRVVKLLDKQDILCPSTDEQLRLKM